MNGLSRGAGVLEVVVLMVLAFGSLVLWVVGPLVGAGLVWASTRWTRSDKVVATGIVVAGLALQIGLLLGIFLVDWNDVLPPGS